MENEEIVKCFVTQVNTLKKCVLGASRKSIAISSYSSANPSAVVDDNIHNVFDIAIEVAETQKVWQFLFDVENPKYFPDVIFKQDNECFFPDTSTFKSVNDWDISNPSALLNLVTEIYESYLKHQRNLVGKYYQIKNEFEEMIQMVECANNCEVNIEKNEASETDKGTITIVIPLDANFESLPPTFTEVNNDDIIWCYLSISFEPTNLSDVTPFLKLSPRLAQCLGENKNLKIPSYKSSLSTYVLTIERLLQQTVAFVVERYNRRRNFMFCLISNFGSCVLEYDSKMFLEASFLLDVDGFHFILFVSLPDEYPCKRPKVSLQSIYNHHDHLCLQTEQIKLSFQMNMNIKTQVQEIEKFISKALPDFESHVLEER